MMIFFAGYGLGRHRCLTKRKHPARQGLGALSKEILFQGTCLKHVPCYKAIFSS